LVTLPCFILTPISDIQGPPKGVTMSHENVMSSMLAYTNVAVIFESDVYMAYLPLAHVLELIAG
jgi:long-subunit acyl-CoA synthetase (AMP-forming)